MAEQKTFQGEDFILHTYILMYLQGREKYQNRPNQYLQNYGSHHFSYDIQEPLDISLFTLQSNLKKCSFPIGPMNQGQ